MTSLDDQLKHLKAKVPFVATALGSGLAQASIYWEQGEAAKYDKLFKYDLGKKIIYDKQVLSFPATPVGVRWNYPGLYCACLISCVGH